MKKYETVLVIGDLQIPFHDPKAVKLALNFAKDLRPDKVILNGDIMDCYEISDFVRSPMIKADFNDEIEETYSFILDLKRACPRAKIIWVEGNHEFRLKKYLMTRAKELVGLKRAKIRLEDLLDFKKFGIDYIQNKPGASKHGDVYTKIGELHIGHWDMVRQWGGFTAKNLLDRKGVSIMQSHTHRMGSHYRTWVGGKIMGAWENGCLCSLDPAYMANPDWLHGFSVVFHKKDSSRFQVVQVPIIDYEFWFGGKQYKI